MPLHPEFQGIHRRLIAAVLLAAGLCGCATPEIPRQPLYGRISGAEGRSGLLSLIPQEGTQAPAARAVIEDGQYRFSRREGPVPGQYTAIVQLERSRANASGIAVFKGVELPPGPDIPPAYDTVASLPVAVPDGGGSLQVDLELPET